MLIAIIAAISKNGVIGKDGRIPWRYPKEQQYFKKVTMGNPVVMGRKTFESLKKPLTGRENIVLSRRSHCQLPPGVLLFGTLEAARDHCLAAGNSKMFIAGGSDAYRLGLPMADVMFLTHLPDVVEGDTLFPSWDPLDWELVETDIREGLNYCRYRRRSK